MSALDLVNRLDHCRQIREGEWIARCPAHDDRSPSLSISEKDDGRVLVKCWAGCGALDVISAVGLEWEALFPLTDRHRYAAEKLHRERTVDELVVEIAMADIKAGKPLADSDLDRCAEAVERLDKGEPSPDPGRDALLDSAAVVGKRESEKIKEFMESMS